MYLPYLTLFQSRGSANFFYKRPDGKYFRLCSPSSFCMDYSASLFLQQEQQPQTISIVLLGGSECKESACNAGDLGSLGREDPPEKQMATHSSILAQRIPQTDEPGELQSLGSQRVRYTSHRQYINERIWLCYNKSLFQRQKGWIWLQAVLSNSSITASQTKNLKISSGHIKNINR